MGLFHRNSTKWEPVTTRWPDERIEVDDREFAEAIERGRRDHDVDYAHN